MKKQGPRDRVSPRSDPRQERSRARRLALLAAAEAIIGEVGVEGLRMREAGRRCSLPIASVYHYFPSAPALVRCLVEAMLGELRAILARGIASSSAARDPREAAAMLVALIDKAGDFMESRPNLPALWGAMRASPELRALDVADTQSNAELFGPALAAILPAAQPAEIEALAMILLESVTASLQLGCGLPAVKRAELRSMLKAFVTAAFDRLIETDGERGRKGVLSH